MGLSWSCTTSRSSERERQERERRLLQQREGVLIPPAFLLTSTGRGRNMNERDYFLPCFDQTNDDSASSPGAAGGSLVNYLQQGSTSSLLLQKDMQPGVWVSTSSGATAAERYQSVLVSIAQQSSSPAAVDDGGSRYRRSYFSGRVLAQQEDSHWNNRLRTTARVSGGTDDQSPRLTACLHVLNKSLDEPENGSPSSALRLWTSVDLIGQGATGIQFDYYGDQTSSSSHFTMGGWVPFLLASRNSGDRPGMSPSSSASSSSSTTESSSLSTPFWNSGLAKKLQSLGSSDRIHGYMAMDVLDGTTSSDNIRNNNGRTTVGVEGAWPLTVDGTSSLFQSPLSRNASVPAPDLLRTYFNTTLDTDYGPPLELTLENSTTNSPMAHPTVTAKAPVSLVPFAASNSSSVSSLSLAQGFTFDRYQVNPMEDKAPRIRNSMGWTVRLVHDHAPSQQSVDSRKSNSMEKEDSFSLDTITTDASTGTGSGNGNDVTDRSVSNSSNGRTWLQLGGAWQINRGLGLKAVLNLNNAADPPLSLQTAILLKRWRRPSVTCSILHRHELTVGDGRRPSLASHFCGIGIDVETTSSDIFQNSDRSMDESYNVTSSYGGSDRVPETKVVVPSRRTYITTRRETTVIYQTK